MKTPANRHVKAPSGFEPLFPTARRIAPVSDRAGEHIAGLVDGEGCFVIRAANPARQRSWLCEFKMHLRADDRPLLDRLQRDTGIGVVRDGRRRRSGGDQPSAVWIVRKRHECFALADLLTRCPLWSKKSRDFDCWRSALAAWEEQNWPRMEAVASRMRAERAYPEAA